MSTSLEEKNDLGQHAASKDEVDDILSTPFPDESGGASDPEEDAARSIARQGQSDNEPVEGEEEAAAKLLEEEEAQKKAAAGSTTITPETLAEAIRKALPPVEQKREEPVQLTPEQIREKLKVWTPTDEWSKRLLDPETQAAALAEMQIATVNQALAGASVILQDREARIHEQYQPILSHYQQQQLQDFTSGFFAKYEGLKSCPTEVLDTIYQRNAPAFAGKTRDQIYDILAGDAEKVMKQIKPDFILSKASPKATATVKKPSVLSGGGQGGAGESTIKPNSKKLNDGLWD